MEKPLLQAPSMLVKEVILEDFMSYEYARVPLKPGLNVITGPNGSGKSSILLGISVALGQTYTERSKKLADLIRRGAEAARVSIVFDNSPRDGRRPVPSSRADDFIVSRYIKSDGSYWFEADRREVSKMELNSVLGRFGINPNDSLVIMHQNMIENFSSSSSQDVLLLFEDAVGISALRQSLLEARKRLEEIKGPSEAEVESGKQALAYWIGLHEKYLKKRELSQRLDGLNGELAWMRLVEAQGSLEGQKTRLSELQSSLKEAEARAKTYGEAISRLRAEVEGSSDLVKLFDQVVEAAYRKGRSEEEARELRGRISELRARLSKLEEEVKQLEEEAARWPKPQRTRTEEEVKAEIEEVKATLQTLSDVNEATEENYERMSKDVEDLINKSRQVEENRKAVLSEIADREKRWIERLRELVGEVGDGYKRVLASVGGTGYLKLVGYKEGGDPNEAGLELYAGFRGTPPVKLNPMTHSGGERSVTIMAFLISLQQHVLSPLRAVDEFDVHMDPANKEMISNVLISELSKKSDVEYIYITPGPLPPLPKNVHVLMVQKVEGKSSVAEVS